MAVMGGMRDLRLYMHRPRQQICVEQWRLLEDLPTASHSSLGAALYDHGYRHYFSALVVVYAP